MDFKIIRIDQVDSTNAELQRVVDESNIHEGYVIVANEQLSGRGYGSNYWESEEGKNLTFSLMLKPHHIKPSGQFDITRIVSVAISNILNKYIDPKKVTIKWPNDIYVGKGKIAGILIQNSIQGDRIEYSIVGVGININQEKFYSDAPNPVSLIKFIQKKIETTLFLAELLNEIRNIYHRSFSASYLDELDHVYVSRLFRMGEWASFKEGKETFRARIIGIREYGKLVLETKDGELNTYGFKEVEMVI
jgi:BirA family biotin operon repressor/biotin-[acetyl-CoA-carboxylase] ligase